MNESNKMLLKLYYKYAWINCSTMFLGEKDLDGLGIGKLSEVADIWVISKAFLNLSHLLFLVFHI